LIWLGRLFAFVVALLAVPLGLVLLLLAAIQLPPVQDYLADAAHRLTAGSDYEVGITGLRGSLPFAPAIQGLSIADREGVWLEAEDLHLDLAWTELFRGRVHVRDLSAGRIAVARAPVSTAPEPPPEPIAAITVPDIRWARCDIKSTALLGNVLMTQQALDAGAREALLVREGCVWEGASSNLFAVHGGVLYTAPKGRYILGGITRDLIVELVRQHGLECREMALSTALMASASELWISSSTREMVPVTTLDGRQVGDGGIGPVYRQVWSWYRAFRQQFAG